MKCCTHLQFTVYFANIHTSMKYFGKRTPVNEYLSTVISGFLKKESKKIHCVF